MSMPFIVNAVMTAWADMQGVARLDAGGLALEFQVKDNVFGIIKSQPREVVIPFPDLAEVTFRRRWFSGTLVVRARRLSTLADVPGADGAEIRLRCRRRYRDAGQDLASQIGMRMVTQDLQRMVNETDRVLRPSVAEPPVAASSNSTPQPPLTVKSGG